MFRKRPNTFTRAEQVIEMMAEKLITDGRTYESIARDIGVSKSTVGNIARRHTRWPRPNTFFAILDHYGVEMMFDDNKKRKAA